ncbi:S-layer homology domain-containing protein [Patescibacteria group bacterium]|nr:S-layer homology domain-containing protein [Patescibacteria group bacterium]
MYAMNVLGKTPNTSRTKNFIDIADADPSLVTSIQQSYQLSIFNGYEDGSFRMRNNITRGESLAVLMRIHLGKRLNEETLPWYKNYFNEAKRL